MSTSTSKGGNPPELTLDALLVDIMDCTTKKPSAEGYSYSEAVAAANKSFQEIIKAQSCLRAMRSQVIAYRRLLERSLEACK